MRVHPPQRRLVHSQVRGRYPGRLVIDEVVGEGSLGPAAELTFREAREVRGRLEVAGTPLASFCADAPTFTASLVGCALLPFVR